MRKLPIAAASESKLKTICIFEANISNKVYEVKKKEILEMVLLTIDYEFWKIIAWTVHNAANGVRCHFVRGKRHE